MNTLSYNEKYDLWVVQILHNRENEPEIDDWVASNTTTLCRRFFQSAGSKVFRNYVFDDESDAALMYLRYAD